MTTWQNENDSSIQKSPEQKNNSELRQLSVIYSECAYMQFKKTNIEHASGSYPTSSRTITKTARRRYCSKERSRNRRVNQNTFFLRETDKEISRNKGEKKNTKTNTSCKKHSETRVLVNRVYSTQHVHPMQLKGQAHASTSEKRPESTRIFYPHLVGKRQENLIFLPK